MKRRLIATFALLLHVSAAHAQTGIDQLVQEMVAETFPPTQEEIAGQVMDALVARLQDAPLGDVLSELAPETRAQLTDVSAQGDRQVSVVTVAHRNSFVTVDFTQATCAGAECYGQEFYPVIQWQRSDGTWAAQRLYHFQSKDYVRQVEGLNAEVTGIHKLQDDPELYLLHGALPSNRMPAYVGFLVIGFEDDALVLDYPAFEEVSPILEATIYDPATAQSFRDRFSYDPDAQVIGFHGLTGTDIGRDMVTVPLDDSRSSSRIMNRDPQDSVTLQFRDGVFVVAD